jgi:hypothetical protein
MKFIHNKCGGLIDPKGKRCTKCKKQWNFLSFIFNKDISPIPEPKVYWSIGPLTPQTVAKHLPKWPRWARLLSSVIVIGGLITAVVFLIRSCY